MRLQSRVERVSEREKKESFVLALLSLQHQYYTSFLNAQFPGSLNGYEEKKELSEEKRVKQRRRMCILSLYLLSRQIPSSSTIVKVWHSCATICTQVLNSNERRRNEMKKCSYLVELKLE